MVLAGTRLCFDRTDHPEMFLTEVLPWMRKHALTSDIMVLNFGLHGMLPPDAYAVAHYMKRYKDTLPFAMWKDVSATHFNSSDGGFPGKEVLQYPCVPRPTAAEHSGLTYWLNSVTLPIIEAADIPIIADSQQTEALYNYHRAGECTHFCFPSAPQIWVHTLYQTLLKHQQDLRPIQF